MKPRLIKICLVLFLFLSSFSFANADTLGQRELFNVNPSYDEYKREALVATLRNVSKNSYIYVDDRYWGSISGSTQQLFRDGLIELGDEFDNTIYPKLTELWGFENKPGVDGDPRITILIHDMTPSTGGYFEVVNGYSSDISASSNEREMLFIGAESLTQNGGGFAKAFLAHEFQHLISANKKELVQNVVEEVWFNELRSEYSVSHSGYSVPFSGSILEARATSFIKSINDSLVEWGNKSVDYGSVALFGEYLVDRFGTDILSETLNSRSSGIESINEHLALHKEGQGFEDVFGDWLLALIGKSDFKYSDPGLSSFRASPDSTASLFVPGEYIIEYFLKPFQPQWHHYAINDLVAESHIKIEMEESFGNRLIFIDDLGNKKIIEKTTYIPKDSNRRSFIIIPIYYGKTTNFLAEEPTIVIGVDIEFVEEIPAQEALKNGDLIKKLNESEVYVIEGIYKRYLSPEVIALYGHLNINDAISVNDQIFHSYTISNYVRAINEEKVFTVWPDNTKHWLNISESLFRSTGRDANSIFTVSDLEINFYKLGEDITR